MIPNPVRVLISIQYPSLTFSDVSDLFHCVQKHTPLNSLPFLFQKAWEMSINLTFVDSSGVVSQNIEIIRCRGWKSCYGNLITFQQTGRKKIFVALISKFNQLFFCCSSSDWSFFSSKFNQIWLYFYVLRRSSEESRIFSLKFQTNNPSPQRRFFDVIFSAALNLQKSDFFGKNKRRKKNFLWHSALCLRKFCAIIHEDISDGWEKGRSLWEIMNRDFISY